METLQELGAARRILRGSRSCAGGRTCSGCSRWRGMEDRLPFFDDLDGALAAA